VLNYLRKLIRTFSVKLSQRKAVLQAQKKLKKLIRTFSVKLSQRKAVLQAQKSVKNRLNEMGEYYSGGNFTIEPFSKSEQPPMTLNIGELVY
jgi:hypothetical protein